MVFARETKEMSLESVSFKSLSHKVKRFYVSISLSLYIYIHIELYIYVYRPSRNQTWQWEIFPVEFQWIICLHPARRG